MREMPRYWNNQFHDCHLFRKLNNCNSIKANKYFLQDFKGGILYDQDNCLPITFRL